MLQITIHYDNKATSDHLHALRERLRQFSPVLKEIGEDLAESTKQRFATTTSPDGKPWDKNQDTTLLRFAARFSTKNKKNAAARLASKRPLTGASEDLQRTITFQLTGPNTVAIGSPQVYAATHQFGAKKGKFGTNRRGSPIPWGDIPARPFLGVSSSDEANIQRLLRRYLTGN